MRCNLISFTVKMEKEFKDIYKEIDNEMSDAVSDYQNLFHLFVIGNSSENIPEVRTVVLRKFSMQKKIFQFHRSCCSCCCHSLTFSCPFVECGDVVVRLVSD